MNNVLIVGRSFACRLDSNLTGSWTNLGFDRSNFNINLSGRGGLLLRCLLLLPTTRSVANLAVLTAEDIATTDHQNCSQPSSTDSCGHSHYQPPEV